MTILIFILVLWYTSLFFQSFFLHRYAAHQTFTMSNTVEKFCFLFTWIFQGANYLSAYGYGIMHRMHHAYVDTENDPHSPTYDKNLISMMWRTKTIYQNINDQKISIDDRFTKNIPQWQWFDQFASSWISRIGWGILYVLFFYFFATSWWQWFFLPISLFMAPLHGVIINWFGHIVGYTNYQVDNTSKNLLPFDFLMMGEGYHNNHHKHGGRANFGGVRWHEIDPTYCIMLILDKLKVIRLKK